MGGGLAMLKGMYEVGEATLLGFLDDLMFKLGSTNAGLSCSKK